MDNKNHALPRCKECFICGSDNPDGLNIHFKVDEQCRIVGEFNPKDTHVGFKGIMHGGIVSSVLDDSMSWACSIKTGKLYVTSQLTVNFKKPAPVDKTLIIIAEGEFNQGDKIKRIMNAEAYLTDSDGTIYANAEGKFFVVEDKKAAELIQSFIKKDGSIASSEDLKYV